MDPNPYESPHPDPPSADSPSEVTPLTLYRDAKRNTGLAAVLLLTPPAIAIAAFTTCTLGTNLVQVGPDNLYLLLCFGVPLAILVSFLSFAGILRAKWNTNPNRSRRFFLLLWLTPFCMIAAVAAGFVLAYLAAEYTGFPHGNPFPGDSLAMPIGFLLPPTVTLLLMLWLAWRHR